VGFALGGFARGQTVDPFGLVAEELTAVAGRMRAAVTTEVPALATAAEYFFKPGSEGKRTRSTMLLLLASALSEGAPNTSHNTVDESPARHHPQEVRRRQQRLAEVTELIHIASLMHDDVLDNAATRRGLRALNIEMGNKLAILAGDFLLARASVTLASLRNTEVIELLSTVLEHLVKGEVMQMSSSPEDLLSLDHYFRKTYFKTASLLANSARAVAILGNQDPAVSEHSYQYGLHLGLAFQFVDDMLDFTGNAMTLGKPALSDLNSGIATAPVLFAADEFPEMHELIRRKFKQPGDVEQARKWVEQSKGIERTRQLALDHATKAAEAVAAFPPTDCQHALICRDALTELTRRVVNRTK